VLTVSRSAPFAVLLTSSSCRVMVSGQPWVLQLLITSLHIQPRFVLNGERWCFECHIHALLSIDKAASSPEFGPRHGTSAVRGNVPAVRSDICSADSSYGPLCHPATCSLQGETAEPYSARHRGQQRLSGKEVCKMCCQFSMHLTESTEGATN